MKVYPFILQKTIIKEIKVDENGNVLEERETVKRETVPSEVELADSSNSTIVIQEFDTEELLKQIVSKMSGDGTNRLAEELNNQIGLIYDIIVKDKENIDSYLKNLVAALEEMKSKSDMDAASKYLVQSLTDNYSSIMNNTLIKIKEIIEETNDSNVLLSKISALLTPIFDDLKTNIVTSLKEAKESEDRSFDRLIGLISSLGDIMSKLHSDISTFVAVSAKITQSLDSILKVVEEQKSSFEEKIESMSTDVKEGNITLKRSVEELRGIRSDNKEMVEAMKSVADYMKISIESLESKLKEMTAREEELIRRENKSLAKEHNDRGITLYYRAMYKSAIEEFKKALELDQDLTEIYNNMAMAYTAIGEYDKARDFLSKALEKDPDFTEAHLNMAYAYYKSRDLDKALEMYNSIVNRYPSFARAHTQLGNLLFEMKRYKEAEEEWKKALALNPYDEEAKKGIKMLTEGEV